MKDVIPFVEKTYRVIANKDNRAIAGLSMGGGHTLMATNNNPGVFGYIGVFSSGPRTVDEAYEKQLEAVKAGGVKFYWTGAGTTDMAREGTVNLHSLLEKHGFKTSYKEIPGIALLVPVARFPRRFRLDSVSLTAARGKRDATKNLSQIDSPGGRGRARTWRPSRIAVGRTGPRHAPPPPAGRRCLLHSHARLRRHQRGPADSRPPIKTGPKQKWRSVPDISSAR